jgi:site-specific recombinase XerD
MNEKGKSTLKVFENKMRVKNYCKSTIKTYIKHVSDLLLSFNKDAYHINNKEVKSYLENYKYISSSKQNQVISSIKCFYKLVLNKKLDRIKLERPRKEKKLPRVIDGDYIKEQLSKIENLKHRSILTLTYSVGLRVSEVTNLKIEDIDSKRMLIHIKNAKGRKDRIVPLSQTVLGLLREYFKKYKPKEYLFNGQFRGKYSIGSCQKIYKKYIDNDTSIHTLRHSSFTNLLENGTDLRIIQKIAGHNSSKTTEIYTHVSNKTLRNVNLPI